jgi:hypothetical protein
MFFLLYLSIPIGTDPVETNEALELYEFSLLFDNNEPWKGLTISLFLNKVNHISYQAQ